MSELWDVAIIGAGPAGSTAALHLASAGHGVLLLDKEAFPRDKVCGDALIPDSIKSLQRCGLHEEVLGLAHGLDTCTVFSPSRIAFDIPGRFLTLKRYVFDELIVSRAAEAGARLRRCLVKGIETAGQGMLRLYGDGIEGEVKCRVVIIATGADVKLPMKLALVTRPTASAIALRCYVHSSYPLDRLVISYDKTLVPGYAWIFPLGNGEFNIGCGIQYGKGAEPVANLRELFKRFTSEFPLAAELMQRSEGMTELKGARLRCGLAGTQMIGEGNIVVIGESIGTTFPFTGEGIGKAMESGEIAGRIIHEALMSGDFRQLRRLPAIIQTELAPKFLGYRVAQDWLSYPWFNDFVARRIRKSQYLQRAVAGIVNETVNPKNVFSPWGILQSFIR